DKKQAEQKAEQDKKDAVQESALLRQKIIKNVELVGLAMVLIIAFVLNKRYREKRKANVILENTLQDLKSTQAQLVQSEKMASLGLLTAGIAHEIKNPLNFVTNFSQLSSELVEDLMSAKSDDERNEIGNNLKRNLEKINVHGLRADSIVKNMLEHSRTGNREKTLTDINALCDETVTLAYYSMRAKIPDFNCFVEKNFSQDIPKVKIISQDISRVILNLLNNAFYAVTEKQKKKPEVKSVVIVSSMKHNKTVQIKVKDSGTGMSPEIKNKIFQPFFTTKPTGQGTGLGLSLCYDIIKSHGGEFTVESIEGEYAEFIIVLPL
ncbi:MAG: HAMP domain-containing sensor histidine kinase, partial [Bacteroidota bacterium]